MAGKKSVPPPDDPKKSATVPRKRASRSMKEQVPPSPVATGSRKKTVRASGRNQNGPPHDPPDLHARIADRANELFMHRGGHHGMDLEDWFEAEEGC